MWKIRLIALCVICTVSSVLFLPLYIVLSVLFVVLSGVVFFHDLPFSVHVASIRVWFESFYNSVVNTFHQSNQSLLPPRRQLQSNGIVKNHVELFANKRSVTPNLIPRNKLCNDQDLPESFIMPLKNCNLHSTPLGVSKDNVEKGRKILINEDSCSNSWSDKKETIFSPKSVARNVQTVAGPLLVSTRFNSGISAELSADVSSMGFSGRVAQRGNAKDGVTHQSKYSGIGVFPIVQLNSRSPKHSISPRSSPASKAVRVRIAPPDNSPFGGLENSVFSHSGEGDSMKSVLQVLKEMSRKRIHSQVDEEGDDKIKRQKKEYDENTPKISLDGGLQNKRGRDDSPRSSEEVKRQRRQTNTAGSNEIMSSLSSSLAVKPPHLMKGTKRKAQAVDWSRSTTPVSGKLLKVNVSPIAKPPNQTSQSQDEEKQGSKQAKDTVKEVVPPCNTEEIVNRKQSPVNKPTVKNSSVNTEIKGNECIRIEAGQRRVLARAGDLKEVPIHEIRKYDSENEISVPRISESSPSISVQRIKDPGRRLKDMLAAIDGNDDIDADTSIMSPSVVAILKTAKTSSKQSKQYSESSKPDATGFKSPVSILKTTGSHESHKTVTFSDQVNSSAEKTAVLPPASAVSDSSPQTCLTTATVVSNSINTSISSASETVRFDYSGFGGTFKNANSTLSSPTVTFATSTPSTSVFPSVVGVVTTASVTPQQSPTQSPFSSGFTTEVKTSVSPSPFNTGSPTGGENLVKVSGPSNKADFGKTISSVSPSGFGFGNFKSPETCQAPVLKTPVAGIAAMNSNVNTKNSSGGTPGSFPLTSVVSENTPLKSGLFTFGVGSKPNEANSSEVSKSTEDKKTLESSQKSLFGGFGVSVAESTPNNSFSNTNVKPVTPNFGGFGKPSTTTASSSANVSSSGAMSLFSNPVQTSVAPSFGLSSATAATCASSIFSFGSNPVSANQTSVFGSVTSQPSVQPSMFGSNPTVITSSQSVPNSSSTTPQQSLFGSTQSNSLPPVSNTSTANPPPLFGSFQATTTSTPSFGSSSVFTGMPNKSQGFGSTDVFSTSVVAITTASTSATTCSPSLFNSFSTTPIQSSGFGGANPAVASSFPVASSTTAAPVFGQAASSSLFTFGSPAVTTQNSVFGNSSNQVNTSTTNINGPSSFSSFSRDNNISTSDDKNKPSPFGAPFQTPSFNFGSQSTPSSNTFAFGGSSIAATTTTTTPATPVFNSFKPPEPKPFGFDAPQTSIQNSTPVFAFGQNNNSTQPAAAPSFQFNAASTSQQSGSAGIFNFGAGTNATNSPFGTGINPPVFNIGSGGNPGGSAMFSIGSGGTVARSRTVGRARRTK